MSSRRKLITRNCVLKSVHCYQHNSAAVNRLTPSCSTRVINVRIYIINLLAGLISRDVIASSINTVRQKNKALLNVTTHSQQNDIMYQAT